MMMKFLFCVLFLVNLICLTVRENDFQITREINGKSLFEGFRAQMCWMKSNRILVLACTVTGERCFTRIYDEQGNKLTGQWLDSPKNLGSQINRIRIICISETRAVLLYAQDESSSDGIVLDETGNRVSNFAICVDGYVRPTVFFVNSGFAVRCNTGNHNIIQIFNYNLKVIQSVEVNGVWPRITQLNDGNFVISRQIDNNLKYKVVNKDLKTDISREKILQVPYGYRLHDKSDGGFIIIYKLRNLKTCTVFFNDKNGKTTETVVFNDSVEKCHAVAVNGGVFVAWGNKQLKSQFLLNNGTSIGPKFDLSNDARFIDELIANKDNNIYLLTRQYSNVDIFFKFNIKFSKNPDIPEKHVDIPENNDNNKMDSNDMIPMPLYFYIVTSFVSACTLTWCLLSLLFWYLRKSKISANMNLQDNLNLSQANDNDPNNNANISNDSNNKNNENVVNNDPLVQIELPRKIIKNPKGGQDHNQSRSQSSKGFYDDKISNNSNTNNNETVVNNNLIWQTKFPQKIIKNPKKEKELSQSKSQSNQGIVRLATQPNTETVKQADKWN